ncbi:tRNA (adenosine(37)-N6)-dimethylallyltransferase MiaA [Bacillus weihaiensis]|uniref:tRNA (adenosine(37)-N6)-dimethylallyltransferase MiaA n=1 Tax=Bacillus weihaiensis TaxID=1547283 RepID=UPI002353F73E|nr:tRNA (adenosine(37)-N6)-dimethylallyltransferase MiaA [Bacillus weihaiensis]
MVLLERKKLVVIIGPTAVGKTKLSIDLAKRLNGEIISGDSMQIYKGMDIGTAKITKDEMEDIPHHLIDIKEADEEYSVAEFQTTCRPLIDKITSHHKMPLIVGGTGLYIQSVIYDYQFTDTPSNPVIRNQLERELEVDGEHYLHNKLKEVDPEAAINIHPNNSRRVIRALEIYYTTNKTMSEYINNQEKTLLYDVVVIGLTMDREVLYERINYRVDVMIEQGLLLEAKKLYDSGLQNSQAAKAIGYKELFDYFAGKSSLEVAIEQLKQNSRRYAKRQLTWFRNKMEVNWYDMTPPLSYEEKVDEIFTYIAGKLKL